LDAAAWDHKYRATESLWSVGPNMFVADRMAGRAPGAGLDLASGEGRNAIWLAEQGWVMTAVDFSALAVDRGRSRSGLVDFQVGDVLTWAPGRSFDLIVIAYLQLIEEELRTVVDRAKDWLRPGGELFMVGHDRSNIEEGHGGPQVPEILWDLEVLTGWLDGLRLVERQVVRRPVVADDGEVAFARDTLVRGRRLAQEPA
jgi:SAM-dependent methyltransferase